MTQKHQVHLQKSIQFISPLCLVSLFSITYETKTEHVPAA